MLGLLLVIFLGATAADFVAKRRRGYFEGGNYGRWILQRLAILVVIGLIWILAIRGKQPGHSFF